MPVRLGESGDGGLHVRHLDAGHPPPAPERSHLRILTLTFASLIVLWAQRSSDADAAKNFIYLTIAVTDVDPKSMKLDIKPAKLTFSGYSDVKKQQYHVELEFYEEIDVDNSQTDLTPRDLSLKLQKKDLKEEYWPRLLKTTQKAHFLKTDFDKVSCFLGMCATCCDRVGKKLMSALSHSGSTRMSKKAHQMRTWAAWAEAWEEVCQEAWEVLTSPS